MEKLEMYHLLDNIRELLSHFVDYHSTDGGETAIDAVAAMHLSEFAIGKMLDEWPLDLDDADIDKELEELVALDRAIDEKIASIERKMAASDEAQDKDTEEEPEASEDTDDGDYEETALDRALHKLIAFSSTVFDKIRSIEYRDSWKEDVGADIIDFTKDTTATMADIAKMLGDYEQDEEPEASEDTTA